MHSSFGCVVARTVTGARCQEAWPVPLATAFWDMHINSNVRLTLSHLVHYYWREPFRV